MRILTLFCALLAAQAMPGALASGTARIQQPDGDVKVYHQVKIAVAHAELSLTSQDGVGTIVIQRAGCVVVDELLRCHPFSAQLRQHGKTLPIAIAEGTAWFNPSNETRTLPNSSTRIASKGLVMSLSTTKGTYLTLSGIVDTVTK